MINKIPRDKILYYQSIIENYHNQKDKFSYLKSLKSVREETHSLYDKICGSYLCVAKSISLLVLENKPKQSLDHTLRPSSTLFLPLFLDNYYKKYLDDFELFNNIIQCSKIICKVTKEEHSKITNLKCLTKDIYRVAKVKVFNQDKDCIETEFYTPGFDYLLPEVQKDITEIEKEFGYGKEVK